jgi:hypothetical protein
MLGIEFNVRHSRNIIITVTKKLKYPLRTLP